MAKYSKEKFQMLTDERKAQVLLRSLYELESGWDATGEVNFAVIKNYLSWVECESELYRLQKLGEGLGEKTTRRQILNVIVPLERYLNKNLKDHELLIHTEDNKNLNSQTIPLFVILDHLRSSFNVGSIFRTAECLGVKHIYLVGYTPTPDDAGVKKTSMGTETMVSWSQHDRIDEVFCLLEQGGIPVVALETSEQAIPIEKFECPVMAAILLGNERFGLSREVIHQSSHLVKIPMFGQKNSLNVANTFSIVAYEFSSRMRMRGDL